MRFKKKWKCVFNEKTGRFEEKEVTPIWPIAGGLLIAVSFIFLIIFVIVPYFRTINWKKLFSDDSLPMYVMAEGLNLREGKGTNSKVIKSAKYGDVVKVLEDDETIWVKVKYDGERGYMSIKGLLSQADFNNLDSLWGNLETRDLITDLRDRMSLVVSLRGNTNRNGYRLYHSDSNGKLFWNGRLDGKHVFAFILQDVIGGKRIAAVYSYMNGVPMCESTDLDLPSDAYIRKVIFVDGEYKIEYGNTPKGVLPK